MTIICLRDGIMAADGLATRDQVVTSRRDRKIERLADGTLVAVAGDKSAGQMFFRALQQGAFIEAGALVCHPTMAWSVVPKDQFCALVARPDGTVLKVYADGDAADVTDEEFWTVGTCWEMARGMLLAGLSAEQTVRLCCEHHVYCGGEIQVERVGSGGAAVDELQEIPGIDRESNSWWRGQGLR